MKESQLKLSLISDEASDRQIETIFGEIGNYQLEIVSTNNIHFEQKKPSLFIVVLFDENSGIFEKLLSFKNLRKDRFIFLLNENTVPMITKLVRKGFNKIFYLPDEFELLKQFIISELKGYEFNLHSKYEGLSETDFIFHKIFGSGDDLENNINNVKKIHQNNKINVLIEGETGTGKETLARTIHNLGAEDNPFIEIEFDLYETRYYLLRVERSGETHFFNVSEREKISDLIPCGTIFIKNISELELPLQKKLMKDLSELNSHQDSENQYRVIATSTEQLKQRTFDDTFDKDLFYFLNVARFELVPLRHRKDDLNHLFEHFVIEAANRQSKHISKVDTEIIEFIMSYPWPGNLTELRNFSSGAVTFSTENSIRAEYLSSFNPKEYTGSKANVQKSDLLPNTLFMNLDIFQTDLKKLNKIYVEELLKMLGMNKSKAAKILGISRPTLQNILNS
ncbi:MAG: sigma-54-dependent Fis family transcriptional regulator [Melioribacteraceae bacterium]|nr:sigma-54-dependent Fis family transcriptional regulator [Melioribacteraceae bacterium]